MNTFEIFEVTQNLYTQGVACVIRSFIDKT